MCPDNASAEQQIYRLQHIFWFGEVISGCVKDVLQSLWIGDHQTITLSFCSEARGRI